MPAVSLGKNFGPTDAMDELLFPLCDTGDLLWTRYPYCDEYRELLHGLGFGFEHRYLDAPDVQLPRLNNAKSQRAESGEGRLPCVADVLLRDHRKELVAWVEGGARLFPYAVTPSERRLARQIEAHKLLPHPDAVGVVNSKLWTHKLRQEFGWLPDSRVVTGADEFRRLGRQMLRSGPLLVKEPFGVSGRGLIAIDSEQRLNHLARHLEQNVAHGASPQLLIERRISEGIPFSAQLSVAVDGRYKLHGFRSGYEVGFSFFASGAMPADLQSSIEGSACREAFEAVAEGCAREGYHGPVAIDFLHSSNYPCPFLLEVNARVSLGRLALDLERRLARGPLILLGLSLATDRPRPYRDIQMALDRSGLLLSRRRGTVLPLAVNTLHPPSADGGQGKLFVALLYGEQRPGDVLRQLTITLSGLGYRQVQALPDGLTA